MPRRLELGPTNRREKKKMSAQSSACERDDAKVDGKVKTEKISGVVTHVKYLLLLSAFMAVAPLFAM